MATYQIASPDGGMYEITAPDNATQDQVLAYAQQNHGNQSNNWSDVPLNAIKNLPSSANNFVSGIYQAVQHPINTASTMLDAAAGGLQNITPKPISDFINQYDTNPDAAKRAVGVADKVGEFYKNRYGSEEGLKNTLSTDPIGALADASSVLSLGAGLTSKIPEASKLSDMLRVGADYTNPISLAGKAASGTADLIGSVGKNVLGLTTGVGSENIGNAAKAGFEGNSSFYDNMTGKVPANDILTQAKQALQNMRFNRSSDYKAGIASTAQDATKLDFSPIDNALDQVTSSMKSGGHWKIGSAEASKIDDVANVVAEWRNDPNMHTAMGLDALKQRLDAIYPDSPMQNQAQRAITTVRNAVKDTIVNQSPEYASTMSSYEQAIGLEKEIEKALSLGNKASADTAMRKLQSLTRNNVNTNYGSRIDLANALRDQGGIDLFPALSGQAMNSWTARGLGGQAENLATLGAAALHNPSILATLPLQSPKAVGTVLYGSGKLARWANDALDKTGNLVNKTGVSPKDLALMLYQSGRAAQ